MQDGVEMVVGAAIKHTGRPWGVMQCPGCQAEVDVHGDHLLCCPRNNFVTRQMAVQDTLAGLLQEGGQGVTKEVRIPLAGNSLGRRTSWWETGPEERTQP